MDKHGLAWGKQMKANRDRIAEQLEIIAKRIRNGCGSMVCVKSGVSWETAYSEGGCRCSRIVAARDLHRIASEVNGYREHWEGDGK